MSFLRNTDWHRLELESELEGVLARSEQLKARANEAEDKLSRLWGDPEYYNLGPEHLDDEAELAEQRECFRALYNASCLARDEEVSLRSELEFY